MIQRVSSTKNRHVLVPVSLGFKLKDMTPRSISFRETKYMLCTKISRHPSVECLENGNYHMYIILFHHTFSTTVFEMEQSASKLQQDIIKLKEINRTVKLCRPTPATNIRWPVIDP